MSGWRSDSAPSPIDNRTNNRTERPERVSDRPDVIQQSIPVPFYKIGWIVGKRGSYINQLCRKSGATIVISDSESREYGTTWKYVMISGSGREVDRAKKLLHIRLERFVPRTPQEVEAMQATKGADEEMSTSESADETTTAVAAVPTEHEQQRQG